MATDVSDRKNAQPADRDAALDFLYSRINYERLANVPYSLEAFRLDRMRQLLARVGDPTSGLKAVHIAGTEGGLYGRPCWPKCCKQRAADSPLYVSRTWNGWRSGLSSMTVVSQAEFVVICAELLPVVEGWTRRLVRRDWGWADVL